MARAEVDISREDVEETLRDLSSTVAWLERYTDAYAVLAWPDRKMMLRRAYIIIRKLHNELEGKAHVAEG
jgi:hypothetical protein